MSSSKSKINKTKNGNQAGEAAPAAVESMEPEKPLTTVEQLARVEELLAEATGVVDGLREERDHIARERFELTTSALPIHERTVADTAGKLAEVRREIEQQELRASIFHYAGSTAVAERIAARVAALRETQAELLTKLDRAEDALERERQFVARESERIDVVQAEKQQAIAAAEATVAALADEKAQLIALRREEVQNEARAAVATAQESIANAEQALAAARFQQEQTANAVRRDLTRFGLHELADELCPRPPTAVEQMYAAYAEWIETLAPVAGHIPDTEMRWFVRTCLFAQNELTEILRGLPEDRQQQDSIINKPMAFALAHSIRSNTATARALFEKWRLARGKAGAGV